MLTLLAFSVAYAGFTAICLGMERHHRQLLGRLPAKRTAVALRCAGFALLALALLLCLAAYPGSVGVIAWLGLLTASSATLVFLLPYLPRLAWRLAVVAPLVSGTAAVLQ